MLLGDLSNNKKRFDILTVGHFANDLIISPRVSIPKPTLGGSPTYTSVSARKLDSEVSVISKVGSDFPHQYIHWLMENKVDLSGLKRVDNALTTSFVLTYEGTGRRLQLRSRAPSITAEDIPSNLRSKAIHLAPIAGELSYETVRKARSITDVLSLDPQGFVRGFDEEGNVSPKKMRDPRILREVDILKSSEDEAKLAVNASNLRSAVQRLSEYGIMTIIITRGTKGSLLFHKGDSWEIPACEPNVIMDPTGAGDAFIGGFLSEYIRGRDPIWCASVGSASASFVIEGLGPSRFGDKGEVYERAIKAYEKIKNLGLQR